MITDIKPWIIITMLLSTTACLAHDEGNIHLGLEQFYCYTRDEQLLSFVVPLPSGMSKNQLNAIGQGICLSINIDWSPEDSQAKCDTDTNCEMYSQYKDRGVVSIFVAAQKWQSHTIGMPDESAKNWTVKVTCSDESFFYTRADQIHETELYCQTGDEILSFFHQNFMETSKTAKGFLASTRVKLNWKMLEFMLENGFADPDATIVDSPNLAEILVIMKVHPEMWLLGNFTDPTSNAAKARYQHICPKGEIECYKKNSLKGDEAFVPFGSEEYIAQWFIDFCNDNSESTLYNNHGWSCDMTD